MTSSSRLLFCTLTLLTASVAHAGIWGERGHAREILVRGSLAYAADGRGIAVYDIADPAHIRTVAIEKRDEETTAAAWMGNDLVTATGIGVERFAVADDGALQFLGVLATPEPVEEIAASATWGAYASGKDLSFFRITPGGFQNPSTMMMPAKVLALATVDDYLYVSIDRRGTYVFRPPSMEQITFVPYTANDFELSGNVLWGSVPAGGIMALNVSDPRAPHRISIVALSTMFDGVAVSGSRVYGFQTSGGIQMFDATSPAAPELIQTMSERADTIAAAPNLLIASRSFVAAGDAVSFATPLRLFDTTGAAPLLLGELVDYAGPVSGVWTDGSLAYVVDAPYLRVLDISKTDEPRELRSILIPNIQDHIRVKNGLAVLYGHAFVNLVDVSDPLHPRHVGTWDSRGGLPSAAAIAASTFIEANNHSGLHVVDYSDPAHAVQIGGRIWHYQDVAAGDDVIYALQDGFFLILQIVDGHVIVERGNETLTTGTGVEIAPPNAVTPDYLIGRTPFGLRVYGLSDRFSPVLINEIPLHRPGAMGTGAGIAYVALGQSLHAVNLAAPTEATDTGMPITSAMQISVAGDKIVVADRYRVRVFGPDTPSPEPPPPPVVPPRRRAVGH
jgi:hypothetical protein